MKRQAFTITELLVAMALILFMMAILSEAFVAGLGTFRDLKSIGDMDQKLRTAIIILDRDLVADHFDNNGPLSAPNVDSSGRPLRGFFAVNRANAQSGSATLNPTPSVGATTITLSAPPIGLQVGYSIYLFGGVSPKPGELGQEVFIATAFAGPNSVVLQAPIRNAGHYIAYWGTIPEGEDAATGSAAGSGRPYYATQHSLHFTMNLANRPIVDSGNMKLKRRESYVTGALGNYPSPCPPNSPTAPWRLAQAAQLATFPDAPLALQNSYRSQTAEVAYFLRWNGTTTPGGMPLFTLYRRQAVVLSDTDANDASTGVNAAAFFAERPYSPTASAPTNGMVSYAGNFYDFSCYPDTTLTPPQPISVFFNTMSGDANGKGDLRNPGYRCLTYTGGPWSVPYPILGQRGEGAQLLGADILLTDVVSFCVRHYPSTGTDFYPAWGPANLPGTTLSENYDTYNASTYGYNIKALEITIRLWDMKTQKSRQITLIQNM